MITIDDALRRKKLFLSCVRGYTDATLPDKLADRMLTIADLKGLIRIFTAQGNRIRAIRTVEAEIARRVVGNDP